MTAKKQRTSIAGILYLQSFVQRRVRRIVQPIQTISIHLKKWFINEIKTRYIILKNLQNVMSFLHLLLLITWIARASQVMWLTTYYVVGISVWYLGEFIRLDLSLQCHDGLITWFELKLQTLDRKREIVLLEAVWFITLEEENCKLADWSI